MNVNAFLQSHLSRGFYCLMLSGPYKYYMFFGPSLHVTLKIHTTAFSVAGYKQRGYREDVSIPLYIKGKWWELEAF